MEYFNQSRGKLASYPVLFITNALAVKTRKRTCPIISPAFRLNEAPKAKQINVMCTMQTQAVAFMEKLRGAVLKYITV